MPRPGPRPYECVRRAWHSDRHHPIRGSLIQEIFRIANEVHSSATRKNIEWQEKLPIVVLKAEEIMYSKANSEAEYSDLKTLWDRVNDAIDTIIRRDESSEAGEFLQPCIEAALHLGCTPRRSSRSQRNESPRSYLRPETAEATPLPSPASKSSGHHPTNSSLNLHYPRYMIQNTMNSSPSFLNSDNDIIQNRNHNNRPPILQKEFASEYNHYPSVQTLNTPNTWSVYPLCYFNQKQVDDPKFGIAKPPESYAEPVNTDNHGAQQRISQCEIDALGVSRIQCDLTLRLGP